MTREQEIAWAAGLFEGEGCITNNHSSGVHLEMVSTDLDVLQKFLSIVQLGTIYGPTRQKNFKDYYKDSYRWRLSKKDDIKLVWDLIGPHMCSRRRARFCELEPKLYQFGNTGKKRKPYTYKNPIPVLNINVLHNVV